MTLLSPTSVDCKTKKRGETRPRCFEPNIFNDSNEDYDRTGRENSYHVQLHRCSVGWLLDFFSPFFSFSTLILTSSLYSCFCLLAFCSWIVSSVMCMQLVTALVRLSLNCYSPLFCFAFPFLFPFLALGMGTGWEESGYSD